MKVNVNEFPSRLYWNELLIYKLNLYTCSYA